MKKDLKIYLILLGIVLLVIIGIFIWKEKPEMSEEKTARCIGQNSELYVQLGCSHCEKQEALFGEDYQYLTVIDCTVESQRQKCIDKDITGTPTWIINEEYVLGFQTIEQLKNLTHCR